MKREAFPDSAQKDYAERLSKDGAAIFLFHGVIRRQKYAVRNYGRKHLTLDRFSSILESLMQRGTAVAMEDVLAACVNRTPLPPYAFVVTFDDGFENNLTVAAPVLRELRIPAMFYVTTGFIESAAYSWTDMIEFAFERTPVFDLDLPDAGLRGHHETPESKIASMDRIRKWAKSSPGVDPYHLAREVWRQLGVPSMEPDPELDNKLNWNQLRELSSDPLFSIGGHGHTHRILSFLSPQELEAEVSLSTSSLRTHLGKTIRHYSYPEGLSHCYSDAVIECLRRHGIECSPTAEEGINRAGDDPFRLKRMWVLS